MKRRNEVIDWHKHFIYKNGKLYWKPREGKDRDTKRWNTRYACKEAGCLSCYGYTVITLDKKMHRAGVIIYEMHNGKIPEGMVLDHINQNKDDNRLSNLQIITHDHNTRRSREINAKGFVLDKRRTEKQYLASRTHKYFGTPCGAYMSYAMAYLNGYRRKIGWQQ